MGTDLLDAFRDRSVRHRYVRSLSKRVPPRAIGKQKDITLQPLDQLPALKSRYIGQLLYKSAVAHITHITNDEGWGITRSGEHAVSVTFTTVTGDTFTGSLSCQRRSHNYVADYTCPSCGVRAAKLFLMTYKNPLVLECVRCSTSEYASRCVKRDIGYLLSIHNKLEKYVRPIIGGDTEINIHNWEQLLDSAPVCMPVYIPRIKAKLKLFIETVLAKELARLLARFPR